MYHHAPSRHLPAWRPVLVGLVAIFALMVSIAPSSAQDPPIPDGPIDPNTGEQSLLDLVAGLPINDIQNALNNFPVPYIVVARADGASPVVIANRAGSPTRVDADSSKATGQGNSGHDLIVEVNTELFPSPRLVLDIDRLGNAPFAPDLQVVVVFPFTAFNDEDASPGGDAPNLFFGYESTAAFNAVTQSYPDGGHAPLGVSYVITPGDLSGLSHLFQMDIATNLASNPIRFIAGHFNAPPGAASPEDAIGMSFLTDPVPALISMTVDTNASALAAGGTTMAQFGVGWTASAPTKVIFDYIENEDFPFPVPSDYGTTVTFNQMPTEQSIDLGVDFASQLISLDLAGNAPIGVMTLDHRRGDGLDVVVEAQQVPTEVSVDLDFGGSLDIEVNDNTMDVEVTATQSGASGFPGSDGLFGYPLRFFYISATNVPDTAAAWDTANQTYSIAAKNEGESIGSVGFVIDDDATSIDDDADLDLPPDQTGLGTGVGVPWAQPTRHIFSVVDDGEHGTAAVRLVDVVEASINFGAATLDDISNAYTLETAAARPLTAYLRLHPESILTDDDAIEATCNVHDFPSGVTTFTFELPPPTVKFTFKNEADPPQGIDEMTCFGFVNTLNFDVLAGDLPPEWDFEFDPEGSLSILAEDGLGGPAAIGTLAVRLWDSTGEDGLGASTASLLGEVLRDARFRADNIPSFTGTWSDGPGGTIIDFDTDAAIGPFAFLGGVQVGVATTIEFGTQFPMATAGSDHYLTFRDLGNDADGEPLSKMIRAGVFGIDTFSYTSTEGGGARTLAASYEADENHRLVLDVETAFDTRFFPDYAIDAVLTVDAVPQSWSFSTDLATTFDSASSADEIDAITLQGDVYSKLKTGSGASVTYGANFLDHAGETFAENTFAGAIAFAGGQTGNVTGNNATQVNLAANWAGGPPANGTAYILASKVTVDASILGIPTQASFTLTPAINGGAQLTLNNPLDAISVDLRSDHSIFGSEYKHIVIDIGEIPATWTAEWGLAPNPHANLQTSAPLGPVLVVLSKDIAANTDAKYDAFETPLGAVNYSAFTREIDRRYIRLGSGSADDRETVIHGRVIDTYERTAQLDADEDHFIMLKDSSFISVRGHGFQCASAQFGPGSFQCDVRTVNAGEINASVSIPVPGDHPFFVALQDTDTKFTIVQIPNIPDTLSAIVGLTRAHIDMSSGAGDVFVYQGPLPGAADGAEALKLILVNTPSFIHADWDLGFPGGVTIDTSNPLEVRLLTQSATDRTVAAFAVGDLSATWGINAFTTDEKCDPFPVCGLYLQFAKVFFNFSANPGLDGYIFTYKVDGSPEGLDGGGPTPGGAEYVPRVSFLMDDFSRFEASAQLELCYFGICVVGALLPDVDIETDLLGSFNVDFWDMGEDDSEFLGDKDYIDNDPWDLWPIFHDQADHHFPFN